MQRGDIVRIVGADDGWEGGKDNWNGTLAVYMGEMGSSHKFKILAVSEIPSGWRREFFCRRIALDLAKEFVVVGHMDLSDEQ